MQKTAMNKQDILKALVEGVQHDVAMYARLNKLLLRQQLCFIRLDNQQIGSITADLEVLINTLESSATHRTKLLNYLGFEQNKDGMTKLIGALPPKFRKQFSQMWETLEAQVQSCQKQNQLNGQISASLNEMLQDVAHNDTFNYSSAKLMES